MAALVGYKCPNCGGNIKFNTATQQFKCESCDSVFTEAQLSGVQDEINAGNNGSDYNWQPSGEAEEITGMNAYSCSSCGAQVVADETTAASSCPYCGSPVMMTGALSGMNKPDCVIPFKLDKKQATQALKRFYNGKFLLPKVFKDENKINEMKAVYVPFWLFDCDANTNVVFDGQRISKRWSDTEYDYTETDHYNIFRSGHTAFSNIPADASSKMNDAYMDSIEPFDYKDMVAFNPAFLSGFLADKYDVPVEASFKRAEKRVSNSTENEFRKTVTGYENITLKSISVSPSNAHYRYALLPVWVFTTKFAKKKKRYTFTINGQTGKVAGELPIDEKKKKLTFAGIAAALAVVGQLFVLLMR